ncbi:MULTISPECIES: GGDEF domain-containing protein [Gammaproteobacteria]|uniref:GGDEF domain-containing protein n=1 Tax=Gammaproteobacteria TaxID=1236 RepID=UPI000DD03F58|nr:MULTISPECIES: GGDEF domain-containing protein [Gammaproteobacteria]RTE87510.1 GGDEF domain-containing protein [Aliidiomarina sp. B3213]TCZ92705.1 GGDEF domain-containing protein [Lysobacter sp. N42]
MVTIELQKEQNTVQVLACSETFQKRGKLAEQLQTTLDIEQLLALYGKEVQQTLQISSLTFAADELVFAVFGYVEQQPQHSAAIYADGEYLGQLVYSKASGFSANDIKKLNQYHQKLIFPLRNAMRYARVRRQAMHDHMTGVGNRLLMEEAIVRAKASQARFDIPYLIVILDLDGFKAVNDNAGHLVGDRILQRFARTAKAQLRGYDEIFRYGGDEFVLLLKDADEKSASQVFERIQLGMKHDSMLAEYNIGCSAGAALMSNKPEEEQVLLNRADTALYEAKLSGKNKICFAN